MKGIIISISLVAMALASCSIEETAPVVSDGSHLVLTGDAYKATRVSIGEKEGDIYPLLWSEGDAVSINTKDYSLGGALVGQMADLAPESAGSSHGTFSTRYDVIPVADMDLLILYPGEAMYYNNGSVRGTVAAVQECSVNSTDNIGQCCFAIGESSVKEGQTEGISFSLDHKTAFVKMIVEKSLDYPDYRLAGVSISADGHILSGNVSYDVDTGEITVSGASSSAGVTVSDGLYLSEEQSVYFTALPCDLTGTQVEVTVSVLDDGDNLITFFPFTIDGGKLTASCLSIIKIEVVNGDAEWYESVDVRDFVNGRWAYGPQNTYFIEQPATGAGHVNIEVKARGDVNNVRQPRYYALLTGSSERDGVKLCYLPDGTDTVQDTPTNVVNSDCTIDVYCYGQNEGAGTWATVGIYDKDYVLLWSFMIWKYLAEDAPQDVVYSTGHTFLDRHIGSAYSNKLAEQKGTWDGTAAYFQFGRKDPFPWDQSSAFYIKDVEAGSNFETGINFPTTVFCKSGNSDWKEDTGGGDYENPWGGEYGANLTESELKVGAKTIYDPCPKGYQIPNADFLFTLKNQTFWTVTTAGKNSTNEGRINPDSPFYADGQSVCVYKLANGENDYWPYLGFLNGRNSSSWDYWSSDIGSDGAGNGSGRTIDNKSYGWAFWGCSIRASQTTVGICPVYRYYDDCSTQNSYNTMGRNSPCPIRCVKEN